MRFSTAIAASALIAACICLASPGMSGARPVQSAADAEALDEAIDSVLQRRAYQWRMPRSGSAVELEEAGGPIASFFNWLGDALSSAFKYIGDRLRALIEWVEGFFPEPSPRPAQSGTGWMTPVRSLLIGLLALLVAGLVYGVWRLSKRQPLSKSIPAAGVDAASPDLSEEGISASELPAERWLGMAKEMIDRGDLRLAMRALYLSTLARLGDRGLLTIEFFKSNLDYQRELAWRAHEQEELRSAFARSVSHFERIWYGLRKITRQELDAFARLQEKITRFAESETL
jgi:hypothetical protein